MRELVTCLLLVGLILLLSCYLDIKISFSTNSNSEGFGTDDRPFEPDNMLLNRNPWDDVDYVRPVFLTPVEPL